MNGPTITVAAVQALQHRARLSMLCASLGAKTGKSERFENARLYAKALAEVLNGVGQTLADRDARLGGYEAQGELQAAVARLPVGFERLSMSEVRELLAGHLVAYCPNLVADFEADAVQQLIHSMVPVVKLDDEHAIARVYMGDGAGLHSAASDGSAIVAQGGAT